MIAIREGDYNPDESRIELYHSIMDPAGLQNLAGSNQELILRL